MLNNLVAPLFFSWIGAVACWTYTDYYSTTTGIFLIGDGKSYTSTFSEKVHPTGSFSPTSTNITTALVTNFRGGGWPQATYPITITQLFLSPDDIAICTSRCSSSQTTSPTATIDTAYYAPVVISAPSSCTKTSFLYTTPMAIPLSRLGSLHDTQLADQATESSEALFITTFISTLSTNLGGQAVTTTRCDVYLKDEAVLGLHISDELYYLDQCVDPRRFMCTSTMTAVPSGSCQITGGAYPPNGKTGGVSGTGPSVTGKNGVGGLGALTSQGLRLLILPIAILVFSLL